MSRFLKLLNSVLNEQEQPNTDPNQLPTLETGTEDTAPTPEGLDSEEGSALPKPEDVAMDSEKYKLLLDALRKALLIAYKSDFDIKREISNINIDNVNTDDLNALEKIEDKLMAFLDQSSNPKSSED